MGTASLVPPEIKEGNIRGDLAAVSFNGDLELAQYIVNYINTDIGYKLFWRLNSGSTRGRVVISNLKEYPIVLPDRDTIIKINEIVEKGEELKQTKHQQAQALLNSIDDYLLTELGITLPEADNSLDNRMFTTMFSQVSGGRFDPFYLLNCLDLPTSQIYTEYSLKELAMVKKGQSITSSKIIKGDYPVIAGGQTSPYSHNIFNEKGNVITVSASGAYSGYVWYHEKSIFASDCSVIKSKDENRVTTLFLSEVLKMKQQEIYNLQQGSGQPHVYPSDLERIKIPLPSLKKQTEIANRISDLRRQAKQLQVEADAAMTTAKAEVERMILGE